MNGRYVIFLMLFAAFVARGQTVPLVDFETDLLLGASSKKKWLSADAAAPLIRGGEKYRVYSLTKELEAATGGKAEAAEVPCEEAKAVKLSPKPEGGIIAIAGKWNAQPRVPVVADTTQEVYIKAAREFLVSKGLKNPGVKLTQVLRIDLEGDGEEEVLLSATNYLDPGEPDGVPSSAPVGSYSFVLLRHVVKGKVQTKMVEGEFYPKAKEFNAPGRYKVAALVDCDGDGQLEIVVHGSYYEGGWTDIHRFKDGKLQEMLSVACGA